MNRNDIGVYENGHSSFNGSIADFDIVKKPDEDGFYGCKICDKSYIGKKDVLFHIHTIHEGKRFQCQYCSHKSTSADSMRRHMLCLHKDKVQGDLMMWYKNRNKTEDITTTVDYNQDLDKVLKPNFEGNFVCQICGKTYYNINSKKNLKQHIEYHHLGKSYPCKICGKLLTRKQILKNHMVTMHGNSNNDNISVENDRIALESKKKPKKIKPEIIADADYDYEMVKVPRPNAEGVYKCKNCDKIFRGKSGRSCLMEHIRTIHEGKRYECVECPFISTTNANLNSHILTVHEEKRYQCEICLYRTSRNDILKAHISFRHKDLI